MHATYVFVHMYSLLAITNKLWAQQKRLFLMENLFVVDVQYLYVVLTVHLYLLSTGEYILGLLFIRLFVFSRTGSYAAFSRTGFLCSAETARGGG